MKLCQLIRLRNWRRGQNIIWGLVDNFAANLGPAEFPGGRQSERKRRPSIRLDNWNRREKKNKSSDGHEAKGGRNGRKKNNNQKDVGVRVDLQANRDDSDNSKRKQVPVLRVSPSVKTAAEQQRPVE